MNLDDLKEHGGPAFPTHRLQWDYGSEERELATKHSGMTLRDYFAAKAMQGICAHHDTWGLMGDEIVKKAYALADNMLAARGAQ